MVSHAHAAEDSPWQYIEHAYWFKKKFHPTTAAWGFSPSRQAILVTEQLTQIVTHYNFGWFLVG